MPLSFEGAYKYECRLVMVMPRPLGFWVSVSGSATECLGQFPDAGTQPVRKQDQILELLKFDLTQNTELIRIADRLDGGLFNLVRGLTPEAE